MRDFIVFIVYVVLSITLSLVGPEILPMTSEKAGLLSLLFLMVCGLAHLSHRHLRLTRRFEGSFMALSTLLEALNRDVNELKDTQSKLERKMRRQLDENIETMHKEISVLQGLVGQLSGKGKAVVTVKEAAKVAKVPKDKDALIEMVRDALRSDRVDLFLQPVVTLPQRKIAFFECFSRIRNRKGELILPQDYIETAEKAGLMAAIDNMLLFRCVQLIRKAVRKHKSMGFFCNLSTHTLKDPHFFGDFIEFITDNPDLSEKLVFEISQQDFDDADGESLFLLQKLTAAGATLCLQQVTTLNFDINKLIESNVARIKLPSDILLPLARTKNPPIDLTDLKMTLSDNGIEIIVEKVENEKDLVELLDYNVDYGQGYLFGEPRLSTVVNDDEFIH